MQLNLGPTLPPATAKLATLPNGAAGVRATLHIMAKLAREGKKTLPVRLAAQQIVQSLPQQDWLGEVNALHEFVRDRIRYVRDIRGVETLQQPERTLQLKSGDCDDKSMLLASLLEAIGHRARFHAIGFQPGKYSHVYTETLIGKRWLPLETTEPWEAGRTPPAVVSHMIVHV